MIRRSIILSLVTLLLSCTTMAQKTYTVKMTVGGQTAMATFYDNPTSRAIIEQMPMTLHMLDLYGNEMCYRYPNALPTDDVQDRGYEVGEIIYWPPRHSFVIRYAQNGEEFDMQSIGKVDSGLELFGHGDTDVTLELVSTTGIDKVKTSIANNNKKGVYSLTGQYLGKDTAGLSRGIYIVDGKKVRI